MRSHLRCDEVRPLLPAVVDDEPSPEVTAHLASCRECRAELAGYREIGTRLALLEVTEVAVPPAFLGTVLASVPGGTALRVRAVAHARAARYALVSLGGAAVGAGAIGLVWWRRGRRVVPVSEDRSRLAASA